MYTVDGKQTTKKLEVFVCFCLLFVVVFGVFQDSFLWRGEVGGRFGESARAGYKRGGALRGGGKAWRLAISLLINYTQHTTHAAWFGPHAITYYFTSYTLNSNNCPSSYIKNNKMIVVS